MSKMLYKFCGIFVGVLVGDCFGLNYEGVFSILLWGEVIDYILERIKEEKELIYYMDDIVMIWVICKLLIEEKKYDNCSMVKVFV